MTTLLLKKLFCKNQPLSELQFARGTAGKCHDYYTAWKIMQLKTAFVLFTIYTWHDLKIILSSPSKFT